MCIKVGSVGQSFTTDLQYLRDTTSSQEQSTLPAVTYSQDDAEDAACISSSGSSRHLVPRYVFPLLHQLCLCLAFTISTELHLLGSQLKWWFPSLFVLYSLFVLLFPLKVFLRFSLSTPYIFPSGSSVTVNVHPSGGNRRIQISSPEGEPATLCLRAPNSLRSDVIISVMSRDGTAQGLFP